MGSSNHEGWLLVVVEREEEAARRGNDKRKGWRDSKLSWRISRRAGRCQNEQSTVEKSRNDPDKDFHVSSPPLPRCTGCQLLLQAELLKLKGSSIVQQDHKAPVGFIETDLKLNFKSIVAETEK